MQYDHYDFVNCLLKVVQVVKNQENLGIKVRFDINLAYIQGYFVKVKMEEECFSLRKETPN